ncbi:TetR family transcriptional regulator [Ectopseudomonas mendocina]|jgi:AcrR family transcriptional regulator|uniref:TetR family transcriptional regulator n=1 Tax=Ectopseudomonas mendocina TaxID=300 RepID=A0A379IX92_ECTME|nr:TetR family transcriptional regulator [Pseudomonas mendocina]QTN45341.1 TetR family transcriptional regulator [Pseudomonas mendocina]SUD40453.1 TetR family transcriptional regulator [Pseudomonas mendocina]
MHNDDAQVRDKGSEAPGKRLLMDAALRLTSTSRSLSSLGLRELAREAGLNPNTFYRHFRDVDDLGLTVIGEITRLLRQPLRDLRREAAQRAVRDDGPTVPKLLGIDLGRGRRVCHETVQLFFDFVAEHPEAFIIGVRELHGASPVLREALRQVMDDFAEDMAEDIIEFKLLPGIVSAAAVRQVSGIISRSLFEQSLDYIGQPQRRDVIRALAEEQIVMLFTGASVLRSMGQLRLG